MNDDGKQRRLRAFLDRLIPISKPDDSIGVAMCIRVADAEVVAPRSRIAKCSRCTAPIWVQDETERIAPKAKLVCQPCLEASVIA